jgi:signal transduction histidine kinase/DNA-binding LacI/PurR family transcriptional regulator/ActR/RegA family two-component response regulator
VTIGIPPAPSKISLASGDTAVHSNGGRRRLSIALLIDYANFMGGGYESHLREVFDAKCRRDGHTLLFLYGAPLDSPHPMGKADNAIFNVLRPSSFGGFIVASSSLATFSGPEPVARLIEGLRPASLCSFGVALPGVPSLVIDNRCGMEAVVEHLVQHHGCRRPVFIAGPQTNSDSEERFHAYQSVLRRHGIPFDPNLVICANFLNDQARAVMDGFLDRGVPFDGVVAANDPMAIGAIGALRKRGRRVPGDIPVTGFDDLLLARVGAPRLTTVAQPFEQVANLAVDTIVAQLAGHPVPECVVLPTRLVCRQSCGCEAGEHAHDSPIVLTSEREANKGLPRAIEALRPRLQGMLQTRSDDGASIASRLVDALVASSLGQPEAFRRAVGDLLEDIGDKEERQQILHDAITWLHDELVSLGDFALERAFCESLSLIVASSSLRQLQQRVAVDDNYFRLRTVGGETSAALDPSSLKQGLRKSFPAAGIDTLFLSCATGATSDEMVPLICLVDGKEVEPAESSFPVSRLLPSLAFDLERRTFLVFPLALGSQLLGVAALDCRDGIDKIAPFRSEITLVLRSIRLNRELVQETMLRERSVQERLATSKRMEALSVLAGGVAHDLNNALGPLVTLPDVILDELARMPVPSAGLADLRADVESIRCAAQRAAQTIKDLLTLGRQGRMARQSLDLGRVVQSCLNASALGFAKDGRSRVTMVLDLTGEPLLVRGAESQLARAVGNLVRNAVEATAADGEVTVKTSRTLVTAGTGRYENIPPGPYAVLSVSDDGCGIRAEDLSRLFEPFFTTKSAGDNSGSGLGLAIVHGVVKEHEGFIDVRSIPGEGTTFSLYFPLAHAHESGPEPRTPLPRGHARILVVDDELVQLRTCRRVLGHLGYEVEVAQSGLAAYDMFSRAVRSGKSPFDLVILDMVLGEELDGLEIFELIQRLFPAQKAIMASGHAPSERAEQAIKKGLPWLSKPYGVETLARIVERALEGDGQGCLTPPPTLR